MGKLLRVLGITVTTFLIVVFATFTFLFIRKVWFGKGTVTSKPHVSVLSLTGLMISSGDLIHQLEECLEESTTKVIVLRINSPGGLVAPSQEIYQALRKADAKKPVLISMGPLAASGGYYAALGGRKIFANPGTMTASIGVVMEFVNLQKLYEWAKVERFAMTAGKNKAMGSPFRPMKPEEKQIFESMLQDIHGQFKAAVKERRKLSDGIVENYADGRVMTGSQAKTLGFVDELGSLQDALAEARKLAKLPEDSKEVYIEGKSSLLKKLLGEELEGKAGDWLTFLGENAPSPLLNVGWKVMLLAPLR